MIKSKFFFPSFFLLLAFLIFFRSPCFFLDGGYWQIKNDSYYDYSLKNNFLKSILLIDDFLVLIDLHSSTEYELSFAVSLELILVLGLFSRYA